MVTQRLHLRVHIHTLHTYVARSLTWDCGISTTVFSAIALLPFNSALLCCIRFEKMAINWFVVWQVCTSPTASRCACAKGGGKLFSNMCTWRWTCVCFARSHISSCLISWVWVCEHFNYMSSMCNKSACRAENLKLIFKQLYFLNVDKIVELFSITNLNFMLKVY